MEIKNYHTSLESTSDVVETLGWKRDTINAEGLPVESGLADYIALSLDNLDAQIKQLKAVEAEIKARKAAITEQKRAIKEETAYFLRSNGLDSLKGVICSSVTISDGKPATTKQKFVSNISKKEIEELVVKSGMGYYEEVEVPATPDVVRVNKRKIALSEVEATPYNNIDDPNRHNVSGALNRPSRDQTYGK